MDRCVTSAVQYVAGLQDIFRTHADPYRAHEEARALLAEIARDPAFVKAVLQQHLSDAETFNHLRKNPVLELVIEDNEYFTLIANCWLPRDDRDATLSHQSVHHHGSLLLTTTAICGSGYETWNFTKPESVPGGDLLFNMSVSQAGRHPAGNIVFVDAYIPHIVFYPEQLSVTLALWSSGTPKNWKAALKKMPLIQRFKKPLKATLQFLGLARALELNVVTLFDYYPFGDAFKGLVKRVMYPMGTNENYLRNMFHVVQQTGNSDLDEVIGHTLKRNRDRILDSTLVERYESRLKSGVPIVAQFEESHRFLPYANLRQEDVRRAVFSSSTS